MGLPRPPPCHLCQLEDMSSAAEVLLELLKIDWEDESPVPIVPLVQQPDAELHQCSNTFSDLAAAAVAVRNIRAKQPPAASLPTADGQGAGWCWWQQELHALHHDQVCSQLGCSKGAHCSGHHDCKPPTQGQQPLPVLQVC